MLIIILGFIINLALISNVFALQSESSIENPIGATSVSSLVEAIAKVVAEVGIMVAAVFIIYSGFLYVSARGSEDQLKKAHTTFTWTIIGTAVILGAWVIATALKATIESLR